MRSVRRLVLILFVPAFVTEFGCASNPVSMAAQEGSTIAIPIGTQMPDTMGYGGEWLESLGIFDDQRGRLTFTFSDGSWSSDPVDPLMVTRLFPDPSTKGAKNSKVALAPGFLEIALIGQIVALVTIPDVPSPGTYDIIVGRKIRTGIGVWDDTVTPVPAYTGEIEVIAGTGTPNEPVSGPIDITGALDDVYPHPTLTLGLPGNPVPAAGRIVVSFPDTKADLLDVVGPFKVAQDTLVSHSLDSGVLTIDFVSPGATLSAVGIVFDPSDPFSAGLPTLGDFVVDEDESRLYDANGIRIHNASNPGGIDTGTIDVSGIR